MNPTQLRFCLLTAVGLVVNAQGADSAKASSSRKEKEIAPGVVLLGRITHPHITESSGIVASRQYPGVFWTHNDGGGFKKQVLYGITRSGKLAGEFRVTGALLHDWEDIAIDNEHHLFVGDIGNNNAAREHLAVYELDEPDPK